MRVRTIDVSSAETWDDVHALLAEGLEFPDYTPWNLEGCIGGICAAAASVNGGSLVLNVRGFDALKAQHPDFCEILNECVAVANHRQLTAGEAGFLVLAYE